MGYSLIRSFPSVKQKIEELNAVLSGFDGHPLNILCMITQLSIFKP